MNVKIDNSHSLYFVDDLCLASRGGHIIEEAETAGAICFSVVSRRPHQGKSVMRLSGHNSIYYSCARAHSQPRQFKTLAGDVSVSLVQQTAPPLRQSLDIFNQLYRMNASQLFNGCRFRIQD